MCAELILNLYKKIISPGRFPHPLLLSLICCLQCSSPAEHTTNAGKDIALDSLLKIAIHETYELQFDEALVDLQQVVKTARETGDQKNEILGTINLGVLYLKFNSEEQAVSYFLQALDLAQNYKREDFLNTIYNNIGIVYSTNQAHDKAIEYYQKALEISRKQKNTHRMGVNLLNLGIEIRKKGNSQKALEHLGQSRDIFYQGHDTVNYSSAIGEIADLYFHLGRYDSALAKYRSASRIAGKIKDEYARPHFALGLAKTYWHLAEYDSAEMLLNTSLEGFKKIHNNEGIIENYTWLANVSQSRRQPEEALKYSNLSLAWKDSLLQEKTSTWISELQMKYEFGKKQKEIEFLQAQATRQKQLWAGSIAVGIVIASLIFFILRGKNTNLRQRNIILQQEQEMSRLTLEKNNAIREQLEKDLIANEKLNELEKQRLLQEIMFKDRELAAKAMHLVNKNEVFTSIHNVLSGIELKDNPTAKTQIEKAKKIIRGNDNMDEEWNTFKLHFEEVHPGFFTQVLEAYPALSPSDLRLSAYLLIDLNSKEIANIFNITPESVRKKKQRLREKLNLEKDEDIRILLNRFRQPKA
jgi:tetratricopeptide (TPR) repeat protein